MRLAGMLILGATLLACRERKADIHRAPERELPRTVPAPIDTATVTSLIGYAGEEVTVAGVPNRAGKPRIAWSVPEKYATVIAVAGSKTGLEIIAHIADQPSCAGEVLLTGRVIVARGLIKQGTTEGDWAEPQLDVTSWRCR